MTGNRILVVLIILITVNEACLKEKNKQYMQPMLWDNFRKQVHCGMPKDTFFHYCEKNGWKGVRGTTGYSSRVSNTKNSKGEVVQDTFMVRTRIIVGNEIDSVKMIVEMTDSSGTWKISRIWVTKEDLNQLKTAREKFKKGKPYCGYP